MPRAAINKVLEEIKRLQPEELYEVERAVKELLQPTASETDREAALRVLEMSGLVRTVKRPPMPGGTQPPPVTIEGDPLSKTIIDERR